MSGARFSDATGVDRLEPTDRGEQLDDVVQNRGDVVDARVVHADRPTDARAIDLRVRERDGQRMFEIDGYFRPHPESKSPEYRRTTIVDLTEDQARNLYDELEAHLTE